VTADSTEGVGSDLESLVEGIDGSMSVLCSAAGAVDGLRFLRAPRLVGDAGETEIKSGFGGSTSIILGSKVMSRFS